MKIYLIVSQKEPGRSIRKIDNFLTSRWSTDIVFPKWRPTGLASRARRYGASANRLTDLKWRKGGVKVLKSLARVNLCATDSGMAPQTVGTAQSGLGNGDPAARGRLRRRIDQTNFA
jgi:hypothetical protein